MTNYHSTSQSQGYTPQSNNHPYSNAGTVKHHKWRGDSGCVQHRSVSGSALAIGVWSKIDTLDTETLHSTGKLILDEKPVDIGVIWSHYLTEGDI